MRNVAFGNTGLSFSAVGLGGIQFSKISAEQVKALIDRARARGINWIETAHGYFDSEEKIGAALDGAWNGLHIISKCGNRDAEGFRARVEESLARLRCDHFDLYQFHGVDKAEDWERLNAPGGALDLARALRRDGVIRHLGVSTHSIELAETMVEADWLESIQIPISFITREFENSPLLPRAQARGLGMLAMKPFGGGRLGSARLCLGYIYRLPGVLPVVGVEEPWQVDDLADNAENPPVLTADDDAEMERIRQDLGKYFCRVCRYCEPCPQEISIYTVLYFPVYIKQMGAERVIGNGEPGYLTKARDCTECRQCETRCPFGLKIPDGLKASLALYDELVASG
jgi:hypothetical protein